MPHPYGAHVPRVSRSQGAPSPECPLPRGSLSPRDPCPRAGRGTPAPGSVPRETLQQQPGVFTSGSRREPCNYSPGHGALSFPGWEAAEHTHTTHRHPKPSPILRKQPYSNNLLIPEPEEPGEAAGGQDQGSAPQPGQFFSPNKVGLLVLGGLLTFGSPLPVSATLLWSGKWGCSTLQAQNWHFPLRF